MIYSLAPKACCAGWLKSSGPARARGLNESQNAGNSKRRHKYMLATNRESTSSNSSAIGCTQERASNQRDVKIDDRIVRVSVSNEGTNHQFQFCYFARYNIEIGLCS